MASDLLFLDLLGGGAWPFLVRGVIRLVNSDNERDLNLLTRYTNFILSSSLHGEGGRWFVISAREECFLLLGANSGVGGAFVSCGITS